MDQIRPFPPTEFMDQAEEEEALRLIPAPDLKQWVVANFLTLGGPLHNPDHDHIAEMLHDNEGFLAFAWASSAYTRAKRMVLGQCEKVMFQQGGWKKARQEQQMRDWFGFVPVYLITIDASFCEKANDSEFCALLEHELYHIGHKKNKDSGEFEYTSVGEPRLYLRGHDVEEFHGVVQRYGASEEVQKMVNLANEGPTISRANIAHACGTCLLKLA